jgi:hypothetical protein
VNVEYAGTRVRKYASATLAAVVFALALAGCAAEHLPDQDLRILSAAPTYKMPPDDLWKEFQRDPKAARAQYFAKAIDISGKVVAVQPDLTKVPIVYFSSPAEPGIRARLLDDRAAAIAKNATPGARITLRCFCEGLTAEHNLLLKSCIQP